jgi:hypothetical protein
LKEVKERRGDREERIVKRGERREDKSQARRVFAG